MPTFRTKLLVDSVVKLADGRKLAYAEYGDPSGMPFVVFHGLPGSRLSWGLLPDSPFPRGVHAIAPDRPGYGGSDPHPGRSLLDWAMDVASLADKLKLDRFVVLGVSGGGPGALACAATMPDRLAAVGVVSGPAPTNAHGVMAGLSGVNHFFYKLAWYAPWLSKLNIRLVAAMVRRDPEKYINTMRKKLHSVDQQILDRSEIKQMLVDDFAEALRRGSTGMVGDMRVNHGCPWGFSLEAIHCHVKFWSCGLDRSVSPAMARYLAAAVPDSQLIEIANAGHLWVLNHIQEVVSSLLQAVPRAERGA